MSANDQDRVEWKALPPMEGGVYVSMLTEVLDDEGIPNVVKTDLESGGLGRITGTAQIGAPWRVQVPAEFYDRALDIYKSIIESNPPDDADAPITDL